MIAGWASTACRGAQWSTAGSPARALLRPTAQELEGRRDVAAHLGAGVPRGERRALWGLTSGQHGGTEAAEMGSEEEQGPPVGRPAGDDQGREPGEAARSPEERTQQWVHDYEEERLEVARQIARGELEGLVEQ